MIEKTIRVLNKEEQQKDIEFWKSKTPTEKLDAVQQLREQWVEKDFEAFTKSLKSNAKIYGWQFKQSAVNSQRYKRILTD